MNKYIILGHTNPDQDSIISGYLLEKLMTIKGYNAEFIIPDKKISKEEVKICRENGLDPTKFQKILPKDPSYKYILVDHNERETPGKIVAIIDHHPTEKDIHCSYYKNVPSSSVSCLITIGNEECFSKEDIRLACLAAMIDTAAFHSSKTVPSDVEWVKKQCNIYGFDYNNLLTASMCPTDISNIKEASTNGLKKHNINEYKVASSFIHVTSPEECAAQIQEMLEHLQTYRKENNYDLFAFIVHDITNFKSTLYKIYEDKIEVVHYDEYTSRGTKIIPDITREFKDLKNKNPPLKRVVFRRGL